ncbi:MAG: Asp-tRNA(Asn)/Glu-tRNA(Gln) amidotransferase subunit GatC [Candidatus Levybacteria bacterium]|nr:Asp-tRNA(Asn)/Glu-tRNA(Gln) amidotransferase subunit GatC [Candidatus Levybacteria bacterium]
MRIDVSHIAKLANLPLTEEEKKKFEKQLEETLQYIEQLKEIDTTGIPVTNTVTDLQNVADEDVARPSLSSLEALANATSTFHGLFKVKAILDQK